MISFALLTGLSLMSPAASAPLTPSLHLPPQEETPAPRAESPLERYERLVSEANAANAAWARDLKALRDAEKAGGPPVPASAWTSPLIPSDPLVWRKDLDAGTKKKLADFLFSYGNSGNAQKDAPQKAVLTEQ